LRDGQDRDNEKLPARFLHECALCRPEGIVVTLEEVAKRARVSTATVSRVLNNLEVVKDSTRRRVLQAIHELNYHPNLHARSLAGGKNDTIGMIVSNISNPFFADVFLALEAAARERGFDVLVENTDYRIDLLKESVRTMLGKRVYGLAIVVSEMSPEVIQDIDSSSLPAVFYDVGSAGPHITNLRVRYQAGMQRVVQYLYSLGHRRMAFIGHHAGLSPLRVREKAFLKTVKQYGSEVRSRTAVGTDSPAGGVQAVRELLSSGFQPTAIVCVNDYMAIGVLREIRVQGLTVPRDISVTGFDNIELSQFAYPALTTLNIPRTSIGKMALESLFREDAPREILLDPELVVRDSTAPAPKS
jgi:LacI family transcriptional regulator